MKKSMIILMIMTVMMFIATGAMAGCGLGTKGITVDGSSGVSMGSYDGVQYSGIIGARGTSIHALGARTYMRGVTAGTNADGSIAAIGAYKGNVGQIGGTGNFHAGINGKCKATIGNVKINGTYSSFSNVHVGGNI